jgi:hypothetical protein
MIETFIPDRYCRAVLQTPHDEAQVQAAILRELDRRGIQAWHLDAGGRQTRRRLAQEGFRLGGGGYSNIPEGWPDIFGLLPSGRALFVEVKRPGCIVNGKTLQRAGKPTKAQLAFLRAAEGAGACALIAWSLSDLIAVLDHPFQQKACDPRLKAQPTYKTPERIAEERHALLEQVEAENG